LAVLAGVSNLSFFFCARRVGRARQLLPAARCLTDLQAEDSGSEHEEKKKKTGKTKAKKDPAAPKRPQSGYMAYGAKRRPELKGSDPDLSFGDLTKKIAAEWNGMSDTEKAPFQATADADKERYQREKEAYEAGGGGGGGAKKATKKKVTKKKKDDDDEDGDE
jgi:hypothetical protein